MLKITFSKSRGLEDRLGQVIKINSNVGSISAAELQRLNDESKAAAAESLASSQQSAQSAVDAENSAAEAASWADVAGANFQAMNAAQFNAIRERNNEEFAASGFVHFGKHDSTSSRNPINQGLWTLETASNVLLMGRATSPHASSKSKSDGAIINVAGVLFELASDPNVSVKQFVIKFPQAPDGRTTFNKSTGSVTTYDHAYQAFAAAEADPTNIEVVTDRVDMWGFEAWLEEVSTANPYVYPNGLIQSQAATMDGITTSASARPVTYYAVFDGDTGSKGRGVNFFNLTDTQKKKVLANHKNNLYYLDDGRLVQWRLRQRTIAGAGNGDWTNVDSTTGYLNFGGASFNSIAIVQGRNDIPWGGKSINNRPDSNYHYYNNRKTAENGIFRTDYATYDSDGLNGECYFLVCGTVNRLNQGAYHPSFNPSGTKYWNTVDGVGGVPWYDNRAAGVPSKVNAFNQTLVAGEAGARTPTGGMGQNSQRPDGRFYDAIYADGQGGICRDMRYSAYGVTPVDFDEADLRVKNGTYRGFERLFKVVRGYISVVTGSGSDRLVKVRVVATNAYINKVFPNTGDVIYLYNITQSQGHAVSNNNNPFYWLYPAASDVFGNSSLTSWNTGDEILVLGATNNNLFLQTAGMFSNSVGGSFLQTDVIGNPANILATPALANGWQGSWIPVIPDGTTKEFPATRKNIGAVSRVSQYTTNNGGSWATGSWSIDGVKNSTSSFEPANRITVITYQAFAKQTEPANNEVVYGGKSGVGEAYYSSFNQVALNRGIFLAESLLNIILKNSIGIVNGNSTLKNVIINEGRFSIADGYYPTHEELTITAPNNDSHAFKALDYNVNVNQQGFKQYAATELIHDGTDWGDDSKIHIVNGESTMTDLNGNTVKVVTHKLKEPIGWIKNKV
jgi:hypothetical protein